MSRQGPMFPGINMPGMAPPAVEQVMQIAAPLNDPQIICMMAATIYVAQGESRSYDDAVNDAVQLMARAIKRGQPSSIKAVLETLT